LRVAGVGPSTRSAITGAQGTRRSGGEEVGKYPLEEDTKKDTETQARAKGCGYSAIYVGRVGMLGLHIHHSRGLKLGTTRHVVG